MNPLIATLSILIASPELASAAPEESSAPPTITVTRSDSAGEILGQASTPITVDEKYGGFHGSIAVRMVSP